MFYLLLVLPLPILIGISFCLNGNNNFAGSGNKIIVSFLEGLGIYLIVIAIFLEGFIGNPFLQIAIFIIGFIVLIFSNNSVNELEPDLDDQIATIKDLLVIFVSTILLFYILLSVFRFQPFYLQFLYAIVGTALFNVLAHYLKIITSYLYDRFDLDNIMFINYKAWYLYFALFVLFFLIAFLNMPKIAINKFVNLNNSKSYFVYPDVSNQMMNRYEAEEVLDLIIDESLDLNAYLNHDGDNLFVYTHNVVTIYNLQDKRVVYTGEIQANASGISIPLGNQEDSETSYQTDCTDLSNCVEYDYSFYYGDAKYNIDYPIVLFSDLDYDYSDSAIFRAGVLHLFDDLKIDSRLITKTDKPFLGFGESNTYVTDVDSYNGEIEYLQVNREDDGINIKVFRVIERDIDLDLPFYSHYRFGMLVFIFLMGFVPISKISFGGSVSKK